jgi:hypothetical protein
MMNKSGSFLAQSGSLTSWIFSPVFCWVPKSILAEFSRNLEAHVGNQLAKVWKSVLWASEELWDQFPNVSTDIGSS